MSDRKNTIPTSTFSNPRLDVPYMPSDTRRTYALEARDTTMRVLSETDLDATHPFDLFNKICDSIDHQAQLHNNQIKDSKKHWPIIANKNAPLDTIARFVASNYHMCHIQTTNHVRNLPISVYITRDICSSDAMLGTYSDDPTILRRCIHEWSPGLSERDMATIIGIIHEIVPNVYPCLDEDLVPCNNVIVNVRTRTYFSYDPKYIFTSKILTDYDPDAEMPRIEQADGTIWTPDSLIPSFTSNPETAALLWKIVAATMRRNKNWRVSPWFYSTLGNNGKGTLCALIRNIIGSESVANLSLPQISNDFYMAQAVGKMAIVADENPVGMFLDDSSNYKNMVTEDPININQKYEKVYSYVFRGMVIQCINDFPRVKDRTGSFIRRLLPIEFDQCFTGRENPAIKDIYLKRPDVLRWFLKTALDLRFDSIEIPQASLDLLEAYREANDPVREFANEVGPKLAWDLVPHTMAYALYQSWMAKNNPASPVLGRNNFISQWVQTMTENHEWVYPAGKHLYSSKGRMVGPEYLFLEYEMDEPWVNTRYSRAKNADGYCTPNSLKPQYRGILRRVPKAPIDPSRNDYEARMAEHQDRSNMACDISDMLEMIEFTEEPIVAQQ